MGDYLEFPEVVQETRGAMHSGRLKMQTTGVVFRNLKTGKVDQFTPEEVDKAQWLKRAKGYCLKLLLLTGTIHRYDGFRDSDFAKVAAFLSKCYSKDLEKVDLSVKGWNWGHSTFVGNSLEFSVGRKPDYKDPAKQKFELAFEVPLPNVSAVTTGKNEVTMEFHQNDDAAVSLMEMRLHIPPDASNDDLVEDFAKNIRRKADILQATGDAIVMLSEVQCLTPRGRYDIKLFSTFLQLHGKTFDYKIPYSTILRFFLLPHKDQRQAFFLVYLDPPIRQGQTRYPFLITLFNVEDEITVELGLSEEVLKEKYDGKLTPEMTGGEIDIVSKIMKALVGKKITVPTTFRSRKDHRCLDCAYRSSNGFLYPLERAFIYIHKPPIFIRFDEVACVNFNRSTGKTKMFDFDVETKQGTIYNFSSIVKEEYGKLFDFVKTKQLKVKNIGGKDTVGYIDDMESDDDQHDAYLERMKQEGQEYESEDEEDDESTDEDFKPGAEGSDVAEEYDSNVQTTDEEGGGGGEGEGEKKSKPAKKKPREPSKKREPKDKSRSKKKDPNMPKRPQSAYFIWLNENREAIRGDNPGISITEVSKLAGEKWGKVTDKSEWEAKAKEAKEQYKVAMETYLANKPADDSDHSEGEQSKAKPKAKRSRPAKSADKKRSSPKKSAGGESKAGTGDAYKSKEFISSDDSDSGQEAAPSKKVKKEPEVAPKEKKPAAKKPAPKESPKKKKQVKKDEPSSESEEESVAGSLPSDEEILSSPTESEEGSDSDSD